MAGSGAKRKILAIGPIEGAFAEYEALSRDFDVHLINRGPRDQVKEQISALCQTVGPFEAAFMTFANFSYAPIDHNLLSPLWTQGNRLRVLAQCGTGYDNVVVGDMTSEGCYFTNTPDAVTQSTADFTVFLFLAVLRGTSYCEMVARSGLWHQGLELSTDPAGLTLGIFGMGRIGKDFVKKVRAFGVEIIYNTRNQLPPNVEAELGIRWVNKDELLRTSDLIACLCPGTPDTYHMIDIPQFALMKVECQLLAIHPEGRLTEVLDGVFVINSSRGMVINTHALISAIKSGKVKRAGIDVFEDEPNIPEWLLNNPRVTVTPHVAAYTTGTIYRGERDAMANVRAYLEIGRPLTPVNGPFDPEVDL